MESFKVELIKEIGQAKYDEEMRLVKLIIERALAGKFEVITGDVDQRDSSLKSTSLSSGF